MIDTAILIDGAALISSGTIARIVHLHLRHQRNRPDYQKIQQLEQELLDPGFYERLTPPIILRDLTPAPKRCTYCHHLPHLPQCPALDNAHYRT